LESAIRPQPHLSGEPIPSPCDEPGDASPASGSSRVSFNSTPPTIMMITNELLNDLVRNFGMSKRMALKYGQSVKAMGHTAPDCTFYRLRNRDKPFAPFFKTSDGNPYCCDIE
jgi:hypothetical protein